MFSLVEPIHSRNIDDLPNLGCAMLIASCQERGIKTNLVKGQTRYLRDMFINDSGELWNLIHDFNDRRFKNTWFYKFKKIIQKQGRRKFQEEMQARYLNTIVDKNPANYFNASGITELNKIYKIFWYTYVYYLENLKLNKLRIVDRYLHEIFKRQPRYIGFSHIGSFDPISQVIRKRIKETCKVPIILGGAVTPFLDLKNLGQIFNQQYFDYLIVGEGEYSLPLLLEALDRGKEPIGIPNIFYKKNGRIKGSRLRPIKALNNLPAPDYSQFDLDLYLAPKRILPLQTARGCSWRKCTFCTHHRIYLETYRTFGVEKIIKTINHLQDKYNCHHFTFHDEELPPQRARQISNAIVRASLKDVHIYAYARAVDGFTKKVLRRMSEAGFAAIHWGIESGSQRILNLMNKGLRATSVGRILKESSKNKIANLCFIMFGFPGETRKEAQQTINFLKRHSVHINLITPTPFFLDKYSPLQENYQKWKTNTPKHSANSVFEWIGQEASQGIYSKFTFASKKLGQTIVMSKTFRYFPESFQERMLCFLISSYGLLSNKLILSRIQKGKLDSIFPIVLGRVKRRRTVAAYQPIYANDPLFINDLYPKKEVSLSRVEEEILNLSSGTLSISDIILILYNQFKGKYKKEYIEQTLINFFSKVFSKNWCIGFSKSWSLP